MRILFPKPFIGSEAPSQWDDCVGRVTVPFQLLPCCLLPLPKLIIAIKFEILIFLKKFSGISQFLSHTLNVSKFCKEYLALQMMLAKI
jgi:hypothetical protein